MLRAENWAKVLLRVKTDREAIFITEIGCARVFECGARMSGVTFDLTRLYFMERAPLHTVTLEKIQLPSLANEGYEIPRTTSGHGGG